LKEDKYNVERDLFGEFIVVNIPKKGREKACSISK
jgi:hypothetical protein